MDPFCHLCFTFVFVTLSCLFLAALWSGKGLSSWLSCILCFSCVFVTFPYDVLGQVWYLVVSITEFSPKIYNKRDFAYFEIVKFSFLRGDVIHPPPLLMMYTIRSLFVLQAYVQI